MGLKEGSLSPCLEKEESRIEEGNGSLLLVLVGNISECLALRPCLVEAN